MLYKAQVVLYKQLCVVVLKYTQFENIIACIFALKLRMYDYG